MGKKIGKEYFTREYWMNGTISGYRQYNRGWVIHGAIAEMITSCFTIEQKMKVLDYGGCFGYHVARIQEQTGCTGFVVDASEWAIAHAQRELAGRTYWMDVGESPLPFPDEYFDFIMAIEVMEHIYKPEVDHALKELHRVLKPAGRIYASIDVIKDDDQVNTPQCNDASHQTLKYLQWWLDSFQEFGFEIDEKATEDVKEFKSSIQQFKGYPLASQMKWTQVVLGKL